MELLKYIDSCEITRPTGERDEWDNQDFDLVYSGECYCVDGRTSTTDQTKLKNPTIYMPETDEPIQYGDIVEVTKDTGEVLKGSVFAVRNIRLQMFRKRMVRIEVIAVPTNAVQ